MRIQISTRRCDVPEPVLDRARDHLNRLVRYDPRLSAVEVVFEERRHQKYVEAVLSVDRREPLVAEGEGPEFQTALDRMIDRLGRKVRRERERAVDRQATPKDIVLDLQVEPDFDDLDALPD